MTPQDFIIALFYAVDQEMLEVPNHSDAKLCPSEVVTLALLCAIKGGSRAGLLLRPRRVDHGSVQSLGTVETGN